MKSAPCPYCSKVVEFNATACGSCGGLLSIGSFVAIRQALAADPTLSLKDPPSIQKLKKFVEDIDNSLAKAAAENQEAERIALQAKIDEIAAKALEEERLREEYLKELKPFKRFLIVRKKRIFFTTVAVVSFSFVVATQGTSYYQEYKKKAAENLAAELASQTLIEAFDEDLLKENFTDCNSIQALMTNYKFPELEAKVQEYRKITQVREAFDFEVSGYLDDRKLKRDYPLEMENLITANLESIFSETDRDEVAKPAQISAWRAEWKDAILTECNLSDQDDAAVDTLDKLFLEINRISTLADSFEWYPASGFASMGWDTYGDNFAADWSDFDVTSSYVRWDVDLISKFGCPSGVKVDVAFRDEGVTLATLSETLPSINSVEMVTMQFLTNELNKDSDVLPYITDIKCM